jgi:hypothetical protein
MVRIAISVSSSPETVVEVFHNLRVLGMVVGVIFSGDAAEDLIRFGRREPSKASRKLTPADGAHRSALTCAFRSSIWVSMLRLALK